MKRDLLTLKNFGGMAVVAKSSSVPHCHFDTCHPHWQLSGDTECSHYSCLMADLLAQADRFDPKVGGRPALVLRSSNEPGELSRGCATMTAL